MRATLLWKIHDYLGFVKYPDGYAANISRSVNAKNGRLSGLKSHDCHVLLQRILPIGLRGFVDKDISIVLFELGNFFQDLCSRTLKRSELEKLEEHIVHILCKPERFFPPSFFDVMVHLALHLLREAILGGPVQYRWMYPIERYLEKLKRYVSNRARPEGLIAKANILKECINNCSLYIDGIETVHNRRERNEDFDESSEGLIVFSQTARPTGGRQNDGNLSRALLDTAHWYLLYNSPKLEPYLKYMNKLKVNESSEATKQLRSLANSLKPHVKEYTVCMVNGIKFHTRDLDNRRVTQNSGVCTEGDHEGEMQYTVCMVNGVKFHTRDLDNRRVTQNSGVCTEGDHEGEMHNFYGHVCKIWKLEYMFRHKVVLFQCEWYNTGTNGRRKTIRTDAHCTSINVTSWWYQNNPFILSSQAKQVFYLQDTKLRDPWKIVQCIQHRGVFNVPKVRSKESNDNTGDSDAFQQEAIVDVVLINVEDNIIEYCMGDVETEVVPEGGTSRDANQNEE
ncbi:hypothetical protein SO802_000810 [Lithocarpus litseifolius]|uniref:DUF4218 domain-containing protein n=1 Tax=Lithocarpus litseifolius TaxID=425828 RepID=A0AAW2DXT6_9ROSI